MKKALIVLTGTIITLCFSFLALADTMTPSTTEPGSTPAPTGPNCMNIAVACEAVYMGLTRHDIWHKCIKPIVAGKRIRGVQVGIEDVESCKTKIEMHMPGYWRKHLKNQKQS